MRSQICSYCTISTVGSVGVTCDLLGSTFDRFSCLFGRFFRICRRFLAQSRWYSIYKNLMSVITSLNSCNHWWYVKNRPRQEFPSYGRDLSDDDIQKIEFLDAVVKEGRVYPWLQVQPWLQTHRLQSIAAPSLAADRTPSGVLSWVVRPGQQTWEQNIDRWLCVCCARKTSGTSADSDCRLIVDI
jgi:hypothetical protein